MTKTIDNSQDIIDSRDVIERIAELESDRDDLQSAIDEATEARDEAKAICDAVINPDGLADEDIAELKEDNQTALDDAQETLDAANLALAEWLDDEDGLELKVLTTLAEEAEGYASDWTHGEALIRDSYFETYARELADDIGAINKDATWPNDCIDWERAADELKMDYTSVDFDGVDYWVRS